MLLFAPFLVPVFITMAVMDKLTNGAISGQVDKFMKNDTEDRFKPREPGHYKSER